MYESVIGPGSLNQAPILHSKPSTLNSLILLALEVNLRPRHVVSQLARAYDASLQVVGLLVPIGFTGLGFRSHRLGLSLLGSGLRFGG